MKKSDVLLRSVIPFHSILSIIILILMPFMLWDLFVLGLPSEGGLGMNPLKGSVPTSFDLIAVVGFWVAAFVTTSWRSIEPLWDNYAKDFLDNVGRFLIIYQAYKWVKNKWFKKNKKE